MHLILLAYIPHQRVCCSFIKYIYCEQITRLSITDTEYVIKSDICLRYTLFFLMWNRMWMWMWNRKEGGHFQRGYTKQLLRSRKLNCWTRGNTVVFGDIGNKMPWRHFIFLTSPNRYAAECNGISIMLWSSTVKFTKITSIRDVL